MSMHRGTSWWRWLAALLAILLVPGPAGAAGEDPDDDPLTLLVEVIDLEIEALDLWWTGEFAATGWEEPEVYYVLVLPGERYTSDCIDYEGDPLVVTGETENAYYCDVDSMEVDGVTWHGVIYLPVQPLLDILAGNMWELGEVPNPQYVPIAIVAHEFSHHIVAEFEHQADDQMIPLNLPEGENFELIADCLAGAFMAQFDLVSELGQDDLSGIIDGLILIGDTDPDMNDHGTASERVLAFSTGFYRDHAIGECMEAYWPEFVEAFPE